MKNIFRILMAVAVLFTASCAKEDISSSIVGGGEVEMTFTANLADLGTRAYGNAEQINNLRYYVFDQNNEPIDGLNANNIIQAETPGQKYYTVHLTLIKGMQYKVLFWADNGGQFYNINPEAGTVTVNYVNAAANDESRDAFYFVTPAFDPATADDRITNVTLKRPFAQLNVITKDYAQLAKSGVELTESKVVGYVPTTLNVFDGTLANETAEVTFDFAGIPTDEVADDGQTPLSMNYILAPADQKFIADITIYYKGSESVNFPTANYSNIPLKRNYKTNIIGNLLTASTDFTVTIDPVFDTPDEEITVVEVSTVADLQEAINNASTEPGKSTEIIINDDIDLSDLFSLGTSSTRAAAPLPIVIPAEKSIDLDLNGCKINAPFVEGSNSKHYYAFENRGTLTIKDTKGNGEINARGNFNYGTMTLESGTINAIDGDGGYGVRNYEGTFTMTGGTIATTLEDDHKVDKGGYDATTLRVDEGATAVINGGTITNICDYTFAIDNYGNTTVKGGTFTSVHTNTANYGTLTIEGGSFTCDGLEGVTAHALWAAEGTATIKGGIFNGKDNYNGFNVCASKGATVYIKGGSFERVHSGSLYGDGTITVSGGTFFDEIPANRLATGYKSVENTDGTYTATFFPANVSTAAELLEAVAQVKDGETVQLLSDITLSEILVINKAITLDGNGKTLTSTAARAINVSGADGVTIKNLTINASGERAINVIQNATNVTIEKVTATSANYTVNVAGSAPEAVVAIKNSTLNGLCTVNVSAAGAQVTLNGGTVNCIDNNTTAGESYAALCLNKDAVGGSIIATDTTVNVTEGSDSTKGRNGALNGTVTINGSTEGVVEMVAAITYPNSDYYYSFATLEEAIEYAKAGDTVQLLSDITLTETLVIPAEKNISLDLNGKTISSGYQEGSTTKHIYPINNYGELTITGGTIEGRGIYNQDGAKLTIKDATVNGLDYNGGACVWSYGTGEVYLNNATMTGNTGIVSAEGYLEINGGTYTCKSGIDDNGSQLTSPTYNIRAYNGLKITGGTFTSRHGVISVGGGEATIENGSYTIQFTAATTSNVVYVFGDANMTIKDGQFVSDNAANKADSGAAAYVSGTDAQLDIYGGTFVGMNGTVSGNVTLYGGTFNTVWDYNHYDNLANKLADGKTATQNADGSWTVK